MSFLIHTTPRKRTSNRPLFLVHFRTSKRDSPGRRGACRPVFPIGKYTQIFRSIQPYRPIAPKIPKPGPPTIAFPSPDSDILSCSFHLCTPCSFNSIQLIKSYPLLSPTRVGEFPSREVRSRSGLPLRLQRQGRPGRNFSLSLLSLLFLPLVAIGLQYKKKYYIMYIETRKGCHYEY